MKILIGCPTYKIYKDRIGLWLKSVKQIIDNSKHEIDYLLVDNSKEDEFFNWLKSKNVNVIKADYSPDVRERVVNSRNILREKALKEGYDYFFSLEQDILPEKGVIEKLLAHDKKIIGCYYSKLVDLTLKEKKTGEIKKVTIEVALIWMPDKDNKLKRALPKNVKGKGLMKIGGFGVGCVLISREVLEKIEFRYEKDKKAFDDMFFCADAKNLGYNLFLDSDIRVAHLSKSWNRETV